MRRQGQVVLLAGLAATESLLTFGCDGTRSLYLLDELAPSTGGMVGDDNASGGTGGGTSEPPVGLGGSGNDIPATLIDDFRDCDEQILLTAGRSGYWYHFAEPSVNLVNVNYLPGPAPDATWGTQQCGIYFTGGCPTCTSAGVGFQLAPEPYDLSAYRGLRVSFESDTPLWAVIVTKDGDVSGYSEYVPIQPTGGLSGARDLWFEDVLPGTGFQGLDHAREIQFTVGAQNRASFGFGIHRVELIE